MTRNYLLWTRYSYMKKIHLSCALVYWLDAYDTGPKLRFTTCSVYQNMTFPTYTWQKIGWNFMQTNEMCRKSCPILQISYMYEIQIFIQCEPTCIPPPPPRSHCTNSTMSCIQHSRSVYNMLYECYNWLAVDIPYSRKYWNLAVWRSGERPPNLNPSSLNLFHVRARRAYCQI